MLWQMNLIHLFGFYLAVIFVIGLAVRFRQYLTVIRLVKALPERWPNLFKLIMGHRGIFLTWGVVLPASVAGVLCLIHTIASRLIWPQAHLTVGDLLVMWPALPVVAGCGIAMVGLDVYSLTRVGNINRAEIEKQFNQAEFWLKSWAAPVVRVLTFGYINPYKMVNEEVAKSLAWLNGLLHSSLWWVAMQTSLRIAFGLSMWLTYGWQHGFGTQ